MSYLGKALLQMAKFTGTDDRRTNLIEIDKACNFTSQWQFAQLNNLLDKDRSCEEFAIEFMTAYNNEIGYKY